MEQVGHPGLCAACRQPFEVHDLAELFVCSATLAETLPDDEVP